MSMYSTPRMLQSASSIHTLSDFKYLATPDFGESFKQYAAWTSAPLSSTSAARKFLGSPTRNFSGENESGVSLYESMSTCLLTGEYAHTGAPSVTRICSCDSMRA